MGMGSWIDELVLRFRNRAPIEEDVSDALERTDVSQPEIGQAVGAVQPEKEIDAESLFSNLGTANEASDQENESSPEAWLHVANKDFEGDGEEAGVDNGLFSNIFDQEVEVEESPLKLLVDLLPDVSAEDLLERAEEVTALMDGWHQD